LLTTSLRTRDDMDAEHVNRVTHPAVASADFVVLAIPANEPDPVAGVTELMSVLKAADVGPYAVDGFVMTMPGHDPRRVLEAVQASVPGATLFPALALAEPERISQIESFATNLAETRGVAFRATSGLRLIQLAMKVAASGPARTDLLTRIDVLQQELPVLLELELLREIVSGRATLPRWLRAELSRVLIHSSPARRLGLADTADAAELQAAVEATGTGWRVLENTGRIPFSARKAMLVAQQTLDRLHAELAYYG
jgi:hypothetical protein